MTCRNGRNGKGFNRSIRYPRCPSCGGPAEVEGERRYGGQCDAPCKWSGPLKNRVCICRGLDLDAGQPAAAAPSTGIAARPHLRTSGRRRTKRRMIRRKK